MPKDELHERYLEFMREIGFDAKYLHRNNKQQDYPYVLKARPNHRQGVWINLDQDIAKLQTDDAYNSYWYRNGYGYSHIHYDDEGHSYETDIHAWVISHAYMAHIFEYYLNRNPTYYYDLMLLSTKFRRDPSDAVQKLAELLGQSPSDVLALLTEEPRDIKRRVVLRATEYHASILAKLICQSGGNASITPSLIEY